MPAEKGQIAFLDIRDNGIAAKSSTEDLTYEAFAASDLHCDARPERS